MTNWKEEFDEWIKNQHGTAGWEMKLENFIQKLLDQRTEEILNEIAFDQSEEGKARNMKSKKIMGSLSNQPKK